MRKVLFFFLLITTTFITYAQEEIELNTQNQSIEYQFHQLMEDANNYKGYEVISRQSILELKDNILDSVQDLKTKIAKSHDSIQNQQTEIASLNQSIESLKTNLASAEKEKRTYKFFGLELNTVTYTRTLWFIILIFALLFGYFLYKYRSSNEVTKEAQKNLKETEAEFEEYRKTSLENQQKLGRMLQDERNKNAKS
ncbi:tRNA (guanine-N1)-methyltransferase [Mesonia sp. K7]|uniref:tRNA (guanine-N1)-methyltransferase n=1 Tax=Mesonia sp. K7 TaxID=2218606 RepID=UPI000DAA30C0|nr:tRNA (guanine-N1)-methyltransferase [Mesonia sp. K7]PZD77909.1 tRNA (guanine-N1)-methyltransferase [Mesonia sp. K7]